MLLRLLKAVVLVVGVLFSLSACTKKGSAESESSVPDEVMTSGEIVYKQYCLTCHLANGGGAPPMNPPLIKTSFVLGDEKTLIGIVLNGMSNTAVDGERYRNAMPGFPQLTDKQVADVLTYVRSSFGNEGTGISETLVTEIRKED
jgi:mono/diheme cytochrome c family protein